MIKRLGNIFWLATLYTVGLGVFESDREYLVGAASLAVIAYVLAGFPWKPVSGDD